MEIRLENTGKRFNREWIFRGMSHSFQINNSYAVLGSNGSGKSTLLQMVCGFARPSEGEVFALVNNQRIEQDQIFRHISLATPYLGLYEDFYLNEILDFHFKFKPLKEGIDIHEIPELLQLGHALNRPIKQFSSGMKQRVRLGLAILSDTPFLFLDEPTSNLDQRGKDWYGNMVQAHSKDRMVMVCSNHQKEEIFFCQEQIEIEEYKPQSKSK